MSNTDKDNNLDLETMTNLSRLHCHCTWQKSSKELTCHMNALNDLMAKAGNNTVKYRPIITEMQKSLDLLKREHLKHVHEYRLSYNRSVAEYMKRQSVQSGLANAYNETVLKTSAWSAGSVEVLRNTKSTGKKRKKKKSKTATKNKKKNNLSLSTTAGKKKQKQ